MLMSSLGGQAARGGAANGKRNQPREDRSANVQAYAPAKGRGYQCDKHAPCLQTQDRREYRDGFADRVNDAVI
jgi:hypothetical protein